MPLIDFERVMNNLGTITPEEIGRCHRVTGPDHKDFYLVENERGDVDEDGQVIEYECSYTPETGFSCKCKSGINGFWNVHHPSGVCKHCRWATAAILEERGYMDELATAEQSRCDAENALPEWYNPNNKTSYYPYNNRTRAMLIIGEDGKEVGDHEYLHRVLTPPKQEGPRPLPPMR